jgi:hypothetical protein
MRPLPDALKFPVLHERIGYWETVMESTTRKSCWVPP